MQQVRLILESFLTSFSCGIDPDDVDQFAEITVNERSSFLDLQKSIRCIMVNVQMACELIRKIEKHPIYNAVARRKLLILRLYFLILNQLGYERQVDEEKGGKILSVMKDFDFSKSNLSYLIKSCLQKTEDQVYQLKEINDIGKAIQDKIGQQNIKVIFRGENGDKEHREEKDIKIDSKLEYILIIDQVKEKYDDEIQENCKISGQSKQNIIKTKKVNFDYDKDWQLNMNLSQFPPKKIYLKLTQQLIEDKNQLKVIQKQLQCIQSNYLDNLNVEFLTNSNTKKAQIQKSLTNRKNQSNSSCFLDFVLQQSAKDTNYNFIQNAGDNFYYQVRETIKDHWPGAKITMEESKRGIDNNSKNVIITKNMLSQCLSQSNYKGASFIINIIDKIREKYPTNEELKIFQQKSCHLIYMHLLFQFNCRSKKSKGIVQIQELLQGFRFKAFIQSKFKEISQILRKYLTQLLGQGQKNVLQKLNPQFSQDINSLLNENWNCTFSMNKSMLFAQDMYISIIRKITLFKEKCKFSLQTKLSSKEKEQSRNLFISMSSFFKNIESRLNTRRYMKYINQQQIEKMEQFCKLSLLSNQNLESPQQTSSPTQIEHSLEVLYVQIKSQEDFLIAIQDQQENLRDLQALMKRLSKKTYICIYIKNNYNFDIKSSLTTLSLKLSQIHLISNIEKRINNSKQIDGFINIRYTYSYGSHNSLKSLQRIEEIKPLITHQEQLQIPTLSNQKYNEQFQEVYQYVLLNYQDQNAKFTTAVRQNQSTQHEGIMYNSNDSGLLYKACQPEFKYIGRIQKKGEVKIDCLFSDQEESKNIRKKLEK